MKYMLFFLFFFPAVLIAQREVLIRSWQDTTRLAVTEREGKLWLQELGGLRAEPPTLRRPLALRFIRLDDADLLLGYGLAEPEKGFYYTVAAQLLSEEGVPVLDGPGILQGDFGVLPPGAQGEKEVRWLDATEEGLDFGRAYRLVVMVELWGPVDCPGERPRFAFDRQWPHYAAAGVGLALVGVGQLYRQQKVDNYDTYRDFRAEGKSKADAQPFFDKAVDQEKSTKLFTYAGWAVLGVDAALFLYRMIDTRQRQKQWDQYCSPSSFSLQLTSPGGAAAGGVATGVEVCWTVRF